MPLHSWSLFALAYFLTTLSPGPNVLLVIRNSMRYGSRGTVASVSGNLLVQMVVVVLVALGVGTLLMALPPVFFAMKLIGATYLVYLGLRQIMRKSEPAKRSAAPIAYLPADNKKLFRESMMVSGSNPKTLIFLSAFMPQFLSHDRPLAMQFVVMYLTIAVTVAVVHVCYSLSARGLQGRFRNHRWLNGLQRASGVLFVALGIKLLMTRRA